MLLKRIDLVAAVAAVMVVLNAFLPSPESFRHLRGLDAIADTNDRPIINTFYVKAKGTGMSEEEDMELLEAWSSAWTSAGWEPRILTIEDALRHPDFDKLTVEIDRLLPYGADDQKNYDRLCYLRWLAMASSGGGWMSDIDVLPLHGSLVAKGDDSSSSLPNDGNFTVWDQTLQNDPVPSLMSGSASEWNRMAHELLKERPGTEQPSFPSDMLVLISLRLNGLAPFIQENKVIKGQNVLMGGIAVNRHNCITLKDLRAVHFSHRAINEGLKGRRPMSERPAIIKEWLDLWRTTCAEHYPTEA